MCKGSCTFDLDVCADTCSQGATLEADLEKQQQGFQEKDENKGF